MISHLTGVKVSSRSSARISFGLAMIARATPTVLLAAESWRGYKSFSLHLKSIEASARSPTLALTARYENLEIHSIEDGKGDGRHVADALDRFQMVAKKDLYPRQLSGGQQQPSGVGARSLPTRN